MALLLFAIGGDLSLYLTNVWQIPTMNHFESNCIEKTGRPPEPKVVGSTPAPRTTSSSSRNHRFPKVSLDFSVSLIGFSYLRQ